MKRAIEGDEFAADRGEAVPYSTTTIADRVLATA
jgi:hypothetical protein